MLGTEARHAYGVPCSALADCTLPPVVWHCSRNQASWDPGERQQHAADSSLDAGIQRRGVGCLGTWEVLCHRRKLGADIPLGLQEHA